jgi:hypothetical protein
MAPAAIRANRLIVQVGMTIHARGFGFRKHQCRMTCPAINSLMLTIKGKRSFIVIKSVDCLIQLPAV